MKAAAAILLCCAPLVPFAAGQSKPKTALDKATLEAYLRHVELYRSEVTYKIDDPKPSKELPHFYDVLVHILYDGGTRDELYYVSDDGQHIVSGDVYNINQNPFQSNIEKLNTKDQPSFGGASAPITIVEFGDLECPDCRMEAPLLHHNVPETFGDKVRVYFKDYPLESIHPWARAAAIAGRCVYHQNAETFWKFYDWIYDHQQEIEPDNLKSKILEWAGQSGLDGAKLGSCIDTKATEPEVNRSIAEGQALGIRGTPTLFINGRKIGGLQWPDLELVLNNELKYQPAK
ncbi:MAG TPA: thioredoxin domain-containing protein [Bryobacteraceae bacterium]|nr:thioredoxin domain-containing protein [Bryobacteraceae bacterium]